METERLSSDNLYHFKSDLTVLKSILSDGFRHTLWQESLPFKDVKQQNFIVCFCDIKIQDASFHRQVYGDNAIVLSKEWGLKNGVSPVRYIHSHSPGVSENYLRNKKTIREIRTKADDHHDTLVQDYSLFSILIDQGKINSDNIESQFNKDPTILDEMERLETEFNGLFEELKKCNKEMILAKYFRSLVDRIFELHNELEHRDAFMRIYTENFTHPSTGVTIKDKVFYDEKEWRSIKFTDKNDYSEFLPLKDNLLFGDDDILAILFKDNAALLETKEFLKNNKTLLTFYKTENKLKVIDDFKE